MIYFLSLLISIIFIIGSVILISRIAKSLILKERKAAMKHMEMFHLMNRWVEIKRDKHILADYFNEKKIESIAIYGMNYIGNRLLKELSNTAIDVKYGIDVDVRLFYPDFRILRFEDDFDVVDAVVVTPFLHFEEIKCKLREKIDCPIINIEDILYEIEGVHDEL